jgi:hypothetical protein
MRTGMSKTPGTHQTWAVTSSGQLASAAGPPPQLIAWKQLPEGNCSQAIAGAQLIRCGATQKMWAMKG